MNARVARLACGDRARERSPAQDGRAPGARRRADGRREPPRLLRGALRRGRRARAARDAALARPRRPRRLQGRQRRARPRRRRRGAARVRRRAPRDAPRVGRRGPLGRGGVPAPPAGRRRGRAASSSPSGSGRVRERAAPRRRTGLRWPSPAASAWPSTGLERTSEQLFAAADSALYRAKREGKNRVEAERRPQLSVDSTD